MCSNRISPGAFYIELATRRATHLTIQISMKAGTDMIIWLSCVPVFDIVGLRESGVKEPVQSLCLSLHMICWHIRSETSHNVVYISDINNVNLLTLLMLKGWLKHMGHYICLQIVVIWDTITTISTISWIHASTLHIPTCWITSVRIMQDTHCLEYLTWRTLNELIVSILGINEWSLHLHKTVEKPIMLLTWFKGSVWILP